MNALRCCRCHRAITTAAASIKIVVGGPLMYGPKCAVKAGLIEIKPRAVRIVTNTGVPEFDPRQMDLLEAVQC